MDNGKHQNSADTPRRPDGKRAGKRRGAVLRWTLLGLLAALLIFGGYTVSRILTRPVSLFESASRTGSNTLSNGLDTPASADGERDETETPDGGEPDKTLPNIVNIMLMGIDAYEDDSSTSGTMPHADVCMVVAVNFDGETVDLISLPRDTFTTTPGYYGYYKLNCVFNVGGGMADPHSGFAQVCRTAEQWLGGISIPYYYGVDFQAVIDLVDAIGGIDYEVDQPFTTLTGKSYDYGLQHLDGDAVLGYLRIRKDADGLDSSRTARQRKMMVAIFQKLKREGSLSQIPALISAANSGITTNTTLSQTTALVNFAMGIEAENIRTRAMDVPVAWNFDWAFGFVDQQNRIDLIREVYGVEAQPVGICTAGYESWLHEAGFAAIKCARQAEKVMSFAGAAWETTEAYAACRSAWEALSECYRAASAAVESALVDPAMTAEEISTLRSGYASELDALRSVSQTATEKLADACGYPGDLSWRVASVVWNQDPDINEVYVDFR